MDFPSFSQPSVLSALSFVSSSWPALLVAVVTSFLVLASTAYLALFLVAPTPRPPLPIEKKYKTVLASGDVSEAKDLPCWIDDYNHRKRHPHEKVPLNYDPEIQEPEVLVSVVVPAYNEDKRIGGMLEEAVDFLQRMYGSPKPLTRDHRAATDPGHGSNGSTTQRKKTSDPTGWEIIVVSDGSTDDTVVTVLKFAHNHQFKQHTPVPIPGPRTPAPDHTTKIPPGAIRVVSLERNRGKGGAVIHGLRHVRGKYCLFADADGATRFSDLSSVLSACQKIEDSRGCAVAIGSRAHLVNSEVVVKRSPLRNALMYCFHVFLYLITPPATSKIRDTQCGFKLFSRNSLKYIIPYMHCEDWHFDIEMLMLAEYARIPIVEVPVAWKEIPGSKLNVISASIRMAWGILILRLAWTAGIYHIG